MAIWTVKRYKTLPSGNKIQTVRKLNAATSAAAETAFLNSFGLPTLAKATILDVIEVPIFAPIIIGIACLARIRYVMAQKFRQ